MNVVLASVCQEEREALRTPAMSRATASCFRRGPFQSPAHATPLAWGELLRHKREEYRAQ